MSEFLEGVTKSIEAMQAAGISVNEIIVSDETYDRMQHEFNMKFRHLPKPWYEDKFGEFGVLRINDVTVCRSSLAYSKPK